MANELDKKIDSLDPITDKTLVDNVVVTSSGANYKMDVNDLAEGTEVVTQLASTYTNQDVTTVKSINVTWDANLTLGLTGGTERRAVLVRLDPDGVLAHTLAFDSTINQRGLVVVPNTLAGKTSYIGFLYNSSISKFDLVSFTSDI